MVTPHQKWLFFTASPLSVEEGHEGNPKAEIRKKPEIRNPSGSALERRARVSARSRSCDF